MAPKVYVILGLLVSLVLLLSSGVAARDMAKTEKEGKELENAKYGGNQGGNGGYSGRGGHGPYRRQCPYRCCTNRRNYRRECDDCYC